MFNDPFTVVKLILAVCFAVVALMVWWVFLRQVERKTAAGVIAQKTFKPAGSYWQYPTGNRTNFWTPTRIPIAESYVFAIRLEGHAAEAWFALNTTAAARFEVGQRVQIEYEERALPPVWRRVYVLDMKAL
jgi:hypothetical protein